MQINIAICDDEVKVCSQVEEILIEILSRKSIEYNIDIFYSGETLCREMEKRDYDIVF